MPPPPPPRPGWQEDHEQLGGGGQVEWSIHILLSLQRNCRGKSLASRVRLECKAQICCFLAMGLEQVTPVT